MSRALDALGVALQSTAREPLMLERFGRVVPMLFAKDDWESDDPFHLDNGERDQVHDQLRQLHTERAALLCSCRWLSTKVELLKTMIF